MTEQLRQQKIKALLRERDGYEQAGDLERVKLVDESLRAHGHELQPQHKGAERRGGKARSSRSRASEPVEDEAAADGDH